MYGKLGILETDGERIQCHICGRWYKSLSSHAWHSHGFTADEYRLEYGLNRGQSLISNETAKKYRDRCVLKEWTESHPDETEKRNMKFFASLATGAKRRTQGRVNIKKAFSYDDHPLRRQEIREKNSSARKQSFVDGTSPLLRPEVMSKRKKKSGVSVKQALKNGTHPFQQAEVRAKALAAMKRPEVRARMSESAKKRASDPTWRESATERLRAASQTPEAKAAHRASVRRPEVRAKMSASARKRKRQKKGGLNGY